MPRTLPQRLQLVPVDQKIQSYYGKRGPLATLPMGRLAPDAAAALALLDAQIRAAGGQLLITDCFRSLAEQAAARAKYERWLAAGKPSARSAAFDSKTMKASFVARPGKSGHNGGRAVDIAHMLVAPHGIPKNQKLDWLWEHAKACGWTPVIRTADEGASEAWHFDFLGPWAHVREHLGYEAAALCAFLDIGAGDGLFPRAYNRWVQAQLWRAGVDVGDIDGYVGKRTKRGAALVGVNLDAEPAAVEAALMALPDQFKVNAAA